MKIRTLIAALLLLSNCVTLALATDISGRWEMEFSTVNGPEKYFYELKVEGENITGKSLGRVGEERPEAVLKEGKIKGDEISWLEYLKDADGKEIKVETTGKIHGDQLIVVRSPSDADPVKATLCASNLLPRWRKSSPANGLQNSTAPLATRSICMS